MFERLLRALDQSWDSFFVSHSINWLEIFLTQTQSRYMIVSVLRDWIALPSIMKCMKYNTLKLICLPVFRSPTLEIILEQACCILSPFSLDWVPLSLVQALEAMHAEMILQVLSLYYSLILFMSKIDCKRACYGTTDENYLKQEVLLLKDSDPACSSFLWKITAERSALAMERLTQLARTQSTRHSPLIYIAFIFEDDIFNMRMVYDLLMWNDWNQLLQCLQNHLM